MHRNVHKITYLIKKLQIKKWYETGEHDIKWTNNLYLTVSNERRYKFYYLAGYPLLLLFEWFIFTK